MSMKLRHAAATALAITTGAPIAANAETIHVRDSEVVVYFVLPDNPNRDLREECLTGGTRQKAEALTLTCSYPPVPII